MILGWRQNDPSAYYNEAMIMQTLLAANSLKNITVELLLSVTQELANHLSTQAFPLQQEVGHTHWSVWNKVPLNQILDAFFWFPGDTVEGRERVRQRETNKGGVRTQSKSVIIPLHFCPWPNVCQLRDRI